MTEKWYKKGLRFTCTGCGKCCTGFPGYVWLTDQEITRIASFLGLEKKAFLRTYCRTVFGKISLKEDVKKNYDCLFLKDNKCQIYSVRPLQCQTFPWWESILQSQETWDTTAKLCPGINHREAKLYSLNEIEKCPLP